MYSGHFTFSDIDCNFGFVLCDDESGANVKEAFLGY